MSNGTSTPSGTITCKSCDRTYDASSLACPFCGTPTTVGSVTSMRLRLSPLLLLIGGGFVFIALLATFFASSSDEERTTHPNAASVATDAVMTPTAATRVYKLCLDRVFTEETSLTNKAVTDSPNLDRRISKECGKAASDWFRLACVPAYGPEKCTKALAESPQREMDLFVHHQTMMPR